MARSAAGVRRRPARGIALVDVIIGSVLLAVGLAVIISLSSRALAVHTDGEKTLTASWLADDLLNMVLAEGPVEFPKIHDMADNCDAPFGEFEYELSIEDQGPSQPFRVTAIVRWPSGHNMRQVMVVTLMSDRGGDPTLEHREPYEPIDREERYFNEREGEE